MDLSIIRTLCKEKNITVKEFAKKIGYTEAGISRTIKNNRTTSDFLEKAANFFGVSVGVFFGEKDVRDIEKGTEKLENTLQTIFNLDKDLIIREWNIIAQIISVNESEDEVCAAWVGLRKMVYASIEKIKSLEVVNLCVRLRNIQPTDELSDFEYRENFDNYIYYELADWVWLLGILNGGDCDKTLTKILYKDSRYLNADLHFTNDR